MEKKQVNIQYKNNKNIMFVYTVLFVVIFAVVFSPFFMRGNGLIGMADSYNEAFPTFVYIRDYIKQLLEGKVRLFDFRIGLGDDVLYTLGYMGIFDIISIISVFIFPEEYIELAYYFSIVLKLYLSGIAFIVYIKGYVKKNSYILCGALLYAFHVFTLFNGLDFPPYLMMRITFPFILKGVDEINEKKLLSPCMIFGLCLQGLLGFYCLYIEVLIVLVYFLFTVSFRIWGDIKKGIGVAAAMFLNGIIGLGLSGIVFIPSLVSLTYGMRKIEEGEKFQLIYDWDTLRLLLGNLCIPDVYSTPMTLSFIGICGMIVCISSLKMRRDIKYIGFILWILSFSPAMGSLMNGLSYSSTRWYFVVAFFASVSVSVALEEEKKMNKVQLILYYVLIYSTCFIHFINSENNVSTLIRIAIFWVMGSILPYIWNCNKKYILPYACVLVMTMGLFVFGPKILGGSGYSANFQPIGTYNIIREKTKDLAKTENFERWDLYDSSLNASLIGNYYGTSEYFSTINKYVAEFFQEMNIAPGIRDALNILRGLDGRQELLSMLSISKYMEFKTENAETREAYVLNNRYFLPLGYTYDSYLTREEFDRLTPIEKNSQILDTIILEEEIELLSKKTTEEFKNKEIKFNLEENNDEKTARVYFPYEKYKDNQEGEIYVQIENLHGVADVYVGNKEIRLKDDSYLYYTGIEEYWFNVSEIKQDNKGYFFDIYFDGETDFEESKLNVYWHPINYQAIKDRQRNILDNIEFKNNTFKAKIKVKDEEMLFLSIPYSTGWKAYINGEEVEILRANIGYMAIPLKEGVNHIYFEYMTSGFRMGVISSISSMIIFVVLYYGKRKCGISNEDFNYTDLS